MFLINYNAHTRKFYKYDSDNYDIMTPMFDESIHTDNDELDFNRKNDTRLRLMCAFCQSDFPNRSQLFYHLGFMGINTNKRRAKTRRPVDDLEWQVKKLKL
jgi:hypothetical protein